MIIKTFKSLLHQVSRLNQTSLLLCLAHVLAVGSAYVEYRGIQNGVELLDVSTLKWETKNRWPFGKQIFNSVNIYVQGRFMMFGGRQYSHSTKIYAYTPSTDTWTEEGDLLQFRLGGAVLSIDDSFLIVGGQFLVPDGMRGQTEVCSYGSSTKLTCYYTGDMYSDGVDPTLESYVEFNYHGFDQAWIPPSKD